jgi:hypothetical protein
MSITIKDLNSHMYSLNIDEHWEWTLNNWDEVKVKVLESIELSRKLYEMQNVLKDLQTDIICESIKKISDKEKLRSCVDKINNVTEFIENNRLID